jgi:4-alpha-glucanotransferase
LARFQFVLLIHAHQPVGNFSSVVESANAHSYVPFLDVLERHPGVHIGLHYSGSLLEWIEKNHPEFFVRLRRLSNEGQIELLGGGFYEPILIAISPEDRREQIHRLANYIEQHFGKRPTGAWLAERVWEPNLPSTLAACGVQYTLVDDHHFLGVGFDSAQLCGDYVAEDLGATVRLIPGWKSLRYLIPYRSVDEIMAYLKQLADEHPGGMVAMGDDCEKFGVWPGTYKHCYEDGWLDDFFTALERASSWLEVATPAVTLRARNSLGRADLPTASYAEMSAWSLPTPARLRLESLEKEFESRPQDQSFLHGGIWRDFFSKYSESNLLHMKMLRASQKLRRLASTSRSSRRRELLEAAHRLILRAQCNDAYWHGVFGGLYSPHLRTELWRSLVEAESILSRVAHGRREYAETETLDFDADGREEVLLESSRYAAVVVPSDGATISALDFRPASATLINSLMRRPEAYHQRLRSASAESKTNEAVSIHEITRAKETGLADHLRIDRWQRHAFRLLVFDSARDFGDYQNLRLAENAALAGGDYTLGALGPDFVQMKLAQGEWTAEKEFRFAPYKNGFEIRCSVSLAVVAPSSNMLVGVEMILNLLAPDASDRYFETTAGRQPLSFASALPAPSLSVVDQWQRLRVTLDAPQAREFWIAPVETISESEDGFERVYQGSQILAVWQPDFSGAAHWSAQFTMRVVR